jgi:hypothetical protein
VIVILILHYSALQFVRSVSAWLPMNVPPTKILTGATVSVSAPQRVVLGWLRLSPL